MDNQTIVEYLVKDGSTQTLKQIEAAHIRVYEQTDKNVAAFKRMQSGTDDLDKKSQSFVGSLGSVRSGIVGLTAGAFLGEEAMTALGNGAMKSATGLEFARSAMHLFALAIIDPTPLGLAAVGIGLIVGALQAQQKQQEAMLKPSVDLIKSVDDLDSAHTTLGKQIQDVTGLSGLESDAWATAATRSDVVARAIRDQAKAYEELTKSQQTDLFAWKGMEGTLAGQAHAIEMARANDANRLQAEGLRYLNIGISENVDKINEQNRVLGILTPNIAKLNDEYRKEQQALIDLSAAHDKNIAKLGEEATAARAASAESQTKNTDNLTQSQLASWTNYYKQLAALDYSRIQSLTALDYSYAQSLEAEMRQRGLLNRDEQRQLIQYATDRAKSLRDIDEGLGLTLRDAHTDREREKAQLAALISKRNVEEQYAKSIADIAQRKADQNEQFAYQKQLADTQYQHQKQLAGEQYQHQKQLAIEARDIQIESAKAAAKIQADSIADALTKTLAAISKRKTEEDAAYKDSTAKVTAAYAEQKRALLDTGTAADQLNLKIQAMYPSLDKDVQKALEMRDALLQAAGIVVPAFSSYGSYKRSEGIGFAGGTGGWKTVPSGFANDTFPIRVSSGEKVNVLPADLSGSTKPDVLTNTPINTPTQAPIYTSINTPMNAPTNTPNHTPINMLIQTQNQPPTQMPTQPLTQNVNIDAQHIADTVVSAIADAMSRAIQQKLAREFLR